MKERLTCATCPHFHALAQQPEDMPAPGGYCYALPPHVLLRPVPVNQSGGIMLADRPQGVMLVPEAHRPPILASDAACGLHPDGANLACITAVFDQLLALKARSGVVDG